MAINRADKDIELGEAAIKKRAHANLLSSFPWCIYCGGKQSANTIEHMPPIGMFRGRQRPRGLEFPCCKECNNGTRISDLVASLVSRFSPDGTTDLEGDEFRKLLAAVANNAPGLLEEMHIGRAGQKLAGKGLHMSAGSGLLRANGPLLTKHMLVLGAKLGFALHFESTKSVVPLTGGVQAVWFSNVQFAKGEIPTDLLRMLPEPRTLRQGVREVSDQFQYAWAHTPAREHALYYASFRQSFAIAAVTAIDRTAFLVKHAAKFPVVVPGTLINPEAWIKTAEPD
jgi:hypothetical protein